MSAAILTELKAVTSGDSTFTGVADSVLEDWISRAVVELNSTAWGALYTQGVAYLAAHKYATGPGLAAAGLAGMGPAAERRARNWAIRFQSTGSGSGGFDSLDETAYGREYKRLRGMLRGPRIIKPSTT